MMGATSSVFVGRQVEWELVSSALEESRASRPQIVAETKAKLRGDHWRAQRVLLSGLSARDVSLLAGSLGFGALTLAAGERLREHPGGHPLYVKSLLSELPPDALAFDGPLPAPHSYAATVI